MTITTLTTTRVVCTVSWRVGQTTLRTSFLGVPHQFPQLAALVSAQGYGTHNNGQKQQGQRAVEGRLPGKKGSFHRLRKPRGPATRTHLTLSSRLESGTFVFFIIRHLPLVQILPGMRPGRPGGNRTPNPRFWRPVLCQLSYWPGDPLRLIAREVPQQRPTYYTAPEIKSNTLDSHKCECTGLRQMRPQGAVFGSFVRAGQVCVFF